MIISFDKEELRQILKAFPFFVRFIKESAWRILLLERGDLVIVTKERKLIAVDKDSGHYRIEGIEQEEGVECSYTDFV